MNSCALRYSSIAARYVLNFSWRAGIIFFLFSSYSSFIWSRCFLACPSSNGEPHTGQVGFFESFSSVLEIRSIVEYAIPICLSIVDTSLASGHSGSFSVSSTIFFSAIWMLLSAFLILSWQALIELLIRCRFAVFISLKLLIYSLSFFTWAWLSTICLVIPLSSVVFNACSEAFSDFLFLTSLHIRPRTSILKIFSIKVLFSPIDRLRNGLLLVTPIATIFLKRRKLIPSSLSISS